MAYWEPKNLRQSRQPSLRADSLRALRQSNDAVILPIVYEFTEANNEGLSPDSLIVPINWPLPRFTTVTAPLEISISKSDRKQNLALLKQKLESPRKRPAKIKAKPPDQQTENTPAKPVSPQSKPEGNSGHLQTTVPLLLLFGIVVVIFAWACFR